LAGQRLGNITPSQNTFQKTHSINNSEKKRLSHENLKKIDSFEKIATMFLSSLVRQAETITSAIGYSAVRTDTNTA
jgi:hypothetical protein